MATETADLARRSRIDPGAVGTFGDRLRQWRALRQVSQLDLALTAGISARHLSFVETGRARASREVILCLCESLDLPMRARNDLLMAGGYAPLFRESSLGEPLLAEARLALDHILRQQEPYPAIVVDRGWNIFMRNRAADRMRRAFLDAADLAAAGPAARNAMKAFFHPRLYRRFVRNWADTAAQIVLRLRHEAAAAGTGEPAVQLLDEILSYPDVPQPRARTDSLPPNQPIMTVVLAKDDVRISYFSTIATFGTPQDITLQELRIKSFFPADAATADTFRRLAAADAAAAPER